MRVLVTGATGFIGKEIVATLIEKKLDVVCLGSLKNKNIDPISYRYFVLGGHYSTILNFTWEALGGAQTTLKRLRLKMQSLPDGGNIIETDFNKYINEYTTQP